MRGTDGGELNAENAEYTAEFFIFIFIFVIIILLLLLLLLQVYQTA